MIIRPYRPDDRPAVVRLHVELQDFERAFRPSRAAGPDISDRQITEYEAMLADDDEDAHLMVAEQDGILIGFAFFLAEGEMLEEDPGQIYVQDIMVTASARRAGVGRALMDAIRAVMADRGIHRIDLQVLIGNDTAQAFYTALGFETAYLGLKLTEDPAHTA